MTQGLHPVSAQEPVTLAVIVPLCPDHGHAARPRPPIDVSRTGVMPAEPAA
ncbi:hypothetical protein OEW28_02730 [Defluviimonas sp. WL0002]|uniref:Uncharacterized protein n=1 Tax=Albidovulum marisflavi TaxID=2984159 RepID=A0ABT2Z8S4_9RHOB|nr:hypothetical protein [Defluviimonas sp. WL0002]MCV2867539.1 hypothetical protein [Defluviimonas sp. WL0002]